MKANTPLDKLYTIAKAAKKHFAGAHAIHTPRALVEEILNKVPLQGNILVLFNVEFVISLIYTYNVDPSTISFYSDHVNKTAMVRKIGVNKVVDTLDNNDMKFDVVIGNPPYQDDSSTNTKNLWPKFVEKAATELTAADGVFALVTPRTWATNAMYEEIFTPRDVQYVNLDECAKHFPGVNSTFSYFVVKNGAPNSPITVTLKDDTVQLKQLPAGGLGAKSTSALSLMSKLATGSYFKPFTSYKYHTDRFTKNDINVSKTKTNHCHVEVLHKMAADGTKTVFYSADVDPKQQGVHRVVQSRWVGRWKDMFVTDDTIVCEQFFQFAVNNAAHALHLKNVLQSKLYTFIMMQSVSGGSLTMKSVARFPSVDLTRSWTDADLYAHFNLTQEEIDLIEATVK